MEKYANSWNEVKSHTTLMSRRTKTAIPTSEKLLFPEMVRDVVENITRKRQLAEQQYDKSAKDLS